MSFFELVDGNGDTGMLVVGAGLDMPFRREADAQNRPDERLITVSNPDVLLERQMLVQAATGQLATRAAHEAIES